MLAYCQTASALDCGSYVQTYCVADPASCDIHAGTGLYEYREEITTLAVTVILLAWALRAAKKMLWYQA